jgi:protein-export membrane protein SecD
VDQIVKLASLLRSGALLAPLKLEQENRVGSELGEDSKNSGLFACLVSVILLFFFSLFYYGLAGLFAFIALLFNLFLVLLMLAYFSATLTLPGIAGIVLTVGMAIDASVLIYERIKELIAEGVPYRQAISGGFAGVTGVILDSNITTLVTGLILFKFGGPLIRGFAVTLIIGIFSTVISGVLFLRSLLDFVVNRLHYNRLKF